MTRRFLFTLLCASVWGCAHSKGKPAEMVFDPIVIRGDVALEKLNDEELFAAGSSAYAAQDFVQAARFFDRIADFHPASRHFRQAVYNAGLAHERTRNWIEALERFSSLSNPKDGTGDSLDAAFRTAEVLYHLERFDEAAALLETIGRRDNLSWNRRIEAQVQQGVCELEGGQSDKAETTLRRALGAYQALEDKDEVDDYFPAQGQFFLGEIFRLHYQSVTLDANKSVDDLSKDLELKSELLLSAQGHYLRAIRMGNGYWATAAGSQIGWLYEDLYDHMVASPVPKELNPEEAGVYRQELKKKIRVLITKAINIYERTLETAERIGSSSPFVERTRESLKKVKDLLVAGSEDEEAPPPPPTPPSGEPPPHT